MTAFPAPAGTDEVGAKLRAKQYLAAVADAPVWAMRQARLQLVRGEIDWLDKAYCPTPPQLAAVVNNLVSPFRVELNDLIGLSKATTEEVIDEEAAGRIGQGLAELAESMRPDKDKRTPVEALQEITTREGVQVDVAAELAKLPEAKR